MLQIQVKLFDFDKNMFQGIYALCINLKESTAEVYEY